MKETVRKRKKEKRKKERTAFGPRRFRRKRHPLRPILLKKKERGKRRNYHTSIIHRGKGKVKISTRPCIDRLHTNTSQEGGRGKRGGGGFALERWERRKKGRGGT